MALKGLEGQDEKKASDLKRDCQPQNCLPRFGGGEFKKKTRNGDAGKARGQQSHNQDPVQVLQDPHRVLGGDVDAATPKAIAHGGGE